MNFLLTRWALSLAVLCGTGCIPWDGTQREFCTQRPDVAECAALLGGTSGTVRWAVFGDATGTDYVSQLAQDPQGNTYVTGVAAGSGNFASLPFGSSSGLDTLFVAKLDGAGAPQFVNAYGGTAHKRAIALGATSNRFVFGGSLEGEASFPNQPSFTFTGSQRLAFARDRSTNNTEVGASTVVMLETATATSNAITSDLALLPSTSASALSYVMSVNSVSGKLPDCSTVSASPIEINVTYLAVIEAGACTKVISWSSSQEVNVQAISWDNQRQVIFALGYHVSTMQMGGGAVFGGTSPGWYLAAFGLDGSFRGSVEFDLEKVDGGVQFVVDPGGALWVAGSKVDPTLGTRTLDVWLTRFDISGFTNPALMMEAEATGEVRVAALLAPAAADLWMVGSLGGSLDLNGRSLFARGELDIFAARLDFASAQPRVLRPTLFGGVGSEAASSAFLSSDGRRLTMGGYGIAQLELGPFKQTAVSVNGFVFQWEP